MPAASFSFLSMANETHDDAAGEFTGTELRLGPQEPVTFLYTGKYPFGFPRLITLLENARYSPDNIS